MIAKIKTKMNKLNESIQAFLENKGDHKVVLYDKNDKIADVFYGNSKDAAKKFHEWVREYGKDYVSWVGKEV